MDKYTFCNFADEIYTSPNQGYPPVIQPLPTERYSLRDTRSLHWSSNNYPFLPFVPAKIEYSGPILGRLSYSFKTLPICNVNSQFVLDTTVMSKWQRLERALWGLAEALRNPKHYYQIYPNPLTYGYTRSHP